VSVRAKPEPLKSLKFQRYEPTYPGLPQGWGCGNQRGILRLVFPLR
jgi:hypothetical protein